MALESCKYAFIKRPMMVGEDPFTFLNFFISSFASSKEISSRVYLFSSVLDEMPTDR